MYVVLFNSCMCWSTWAHTGSCTVKCELVSLIFTTLWRRLQCRRLDQAREVVPITPFISATRLEASVLTAIQSWLICNLPFWVSIFPTIVFLNVTCNWLLRFWGIMCFLCISADWLLRFRNTIFMTRSQTNHMLHLESQTLTIDISIVVHLSMEHKLWMQSNIYCTTGSGRGTKSSKVHVFQNRVALCVHYEMLDQNQ